MQYQIGDWLVNTIETTITHSRTQESVKLEPIATELLTLLAKNSGQIVTREELFEQIWNGRVISDHAIYRVITKLRKALSPEDKNAYIVTVSKRGYKLVKEFKSLADENLRPTKLSASNSTSDLTATQTASNKRLGQKLSYLGIPLILVALFTTWQYLIPSYTAPSFNNSKLLTSEIGTENNPIMFGNKDKYLVYTHKDRDAKFSNIYIKDIATGDTTQLTKDNYNQDKLTASANGETIVAISYDKQSCNVAAYTIQNFEITSKRNLFSCSNTVNDLELDTKGNKLFYTQTLNTGTSHIFSYSLKTGKIEQISKINQEDYIGEFVLSLSPDNSKLAFARYHDWENTDIGIIDLNNLEETLLFKKKAIINSLAWGEGNNYLYYRQNSQTIYAYSLHTKKATRAVYNLTGNIRAIASSPTPSTLNIVVEELVRKKGIWKFTNPLINDTESNNGELIISSSSLDVFPSISHSGDEIAFMSLRDGSQQIWIQDETLTIRKLTSFTDNRKIRRFSWSPNDKYILSETNDREIYKISVEDGEITTLHKAAKNEQIGAAIWSLDGRSILFNSDQSGDWQIYQKSLIDDSISAITQSGGRAVFNSPDHANTLFIIKPYQTGLWAITLNEKSAPTEVLLFDDIDDNSHNAVAIKKNLIYYYSNTRELKYFDLNSQKNGTIDLSQTPNIPRFALAKDGSYLLYSSGELIDSSIIHLN